MLAANIGAGSTVGAAAGPTRRLGAWWWVGSAALGSRVSRRSGRSGVWRVAKAHDLYTHRRLSRVPLRPRRSARCHARSSGSAAVILAAQLIGAASDPRRSSRPAAWDRRDRRRRVVITIYFTAGGLLSSAWVNTLQLIVSSPGFAVAVPLALRAPSGGPQSRSSTRRRLHGVLSSSPGGCRDGRCCAARPGIRRLAGLIQKAYGAASDARRPNRRRPAGDRARACLPLLPPLLGMAARATHPGSPTRTSCFRPCSSNSSRRGSGRSRSRRCFRRRSARATPSCSCWRPRSRRISTSASCSPTRTIGAVADRAACLARGRHGRRRPRAAARDRPERAHDLLFAARRESARAGGRWSLPARRGLERSARRDRGR